MLIEKGIVLTVAQLLSSPTLEEHVRCASVIFITQLIAQENVRKEILRNKEIFSLFIASMKLDHSRYSIFEIFQKISEVDNSFLNQFHQGTFS